MIERSKLFSPAGSVRNIFLPFALIAIVAMSASSALAQPFNPLDDLNITDATTEPSAPTLVVPPEIQAKIDAFITQLGDEQWRMRHDAEEELVNYGDMARPSLEMLILRSSDPDVRERAGSALGKIAENRQFGPSLITLHLDNVAPQAAFEEMAKQANTKFQLAALGNTPPALPKISIDSDRQLFWSVFRQACDLGHVSYMNANRLREITLVPRNANGQVDATQGPAFISGPFMVVANRIARNHSIEYTSNGRRSDMNVQLTFLVEPKLEIIRAQTELQLTEADDENGLSLIANIANPMNMGGYSQGNGWMWPLYGRLQYSPQMGKRLASLKGSATFILLSDSRTLEFPANEQNFSQDLDTTRVILRQVKRQGEAYSVELALFRDASMRQWQAIENSVYSGQLKLVDAQGRALQFNGTSQRNGANPIEITLMFRPLNDTGEPAKLIWNVPLATREVKVPFEFKDLPLP